MADLEYLNYMNEPQRDAVCTTEGPLLIIAGAGSGKTRVLTHRVAYLIDKAGVNPYNILAITFTNKAADEMRQRIDDIVGFGSESIWVTTFHSTCVRILRRNIDRLGYDTHFTIYDSDDQKTLIKDICKRLNIDTKRYKERSIMSAISSAKDELLTPEDLMNASGGDFVLQKYATIYREYQNSLKKNNAVDFDDLICLTVQLFKNEPDVLDYYSERFKYIMVDEYQDTNTAQFELVRLLARKYQNICVVGDDDQSIYKFRGANIYNILNFEKYFPDAKVVKLEQNYRSTQNILDAANEVISNNRGRKTKKLWTEAGEGDLIEFKQFETAYDEADFVVRDIKTSATSGDYKDFAILYRTNAQSRLFEERLIMNNIPYKLIGGVNFYARKEIKDLLAYFKTIDNGRDDLAVRRIINIPKRGIGATTIAKVQDFAFMKEIPFYTALRYADEIPELKRAAASKIHPFTTFIQTMRSKVEFLSPSKLLKDIIDETGYVEELEAEDTDEARSRIENIDELISKVVSYEESVENPTLSGFLEEVALVADIDSLEDDSNHVVLMTLHSAKGLEFKNVYLVGMEDGLFPSYMSINAENSREEIEEERRLAYVGITRAKEKLTLTCAKMRMTHGEPQRNKMSRFVKEIPSSLLNEKYSDDYSYEDNNRFERGREYNSFSTNSYGGGSFRGNSSNTVKKTGFAKMSGLTKGAPSKLTPDYSVGDRVSHIKFGEGTVTAMKDGGRDYEVTVEFDKVGVKKMFASFAKLKKI
ncbi:MAG: DNA helicase PcrA [Lachnospiraceae bacterium]|nr:DNA helicase PcrA [Lachnospiraceae bacterium]